MSDVPDTTEAEDPEAETNITISEASQQQREQGAEEAPPADDDSLDD